MNKKIIIAIIFILILIGGLFCYFAFIGNNKTVLNAQENINDNTVKKQESNTKEENNKISDSSSKVAVIYFSATGNTRKIAEYIKNATSGDIIEIVPKEKYTSEDLSYNNDCRANREQQDKSTRPEIENNIDVTKYDTIFLGYPIWWGDVPKIILSFIDNNNLDGKTVIPFCTSGSTEISQSQSTLKEYNKNMNLLNGKRFSSSATQEAISSWIKELGF